MTNKEQSEKKIKSPIRWVGILFAFAVNTLLVTLLSSFLPGIDYSYAITVVGPLVAGVITSLYIRERGGIHAVIGGLLSIPLLALFILADNDIINWQHAVVAGSFCGFGGTLTEIIRRRQQ